LQGEAEKQPDSEIQRRLLAAAKTLADATARMVEAARLCASNPHDAQRQNQLRQAVEELRAATTAAATPALRKKLITRLEVRNVKPSVRSVGQLMNVCAYIVITELLAGGSQACSQYSNTVHCSCSGGSTPQH
jgi:hypothetical protein